MRSPVFSSLVSQVRRALTFSSILPRLNRRACGFLTALAAALLFNGNAANAQTTFTCSAQGGTNCALSVGASQSTASTSSFNVPTAGTISSISIQLHGVWADGVNGYSMWAAEFLLTGPGGKFDLLGETGDTVDGADDGSANSGLHGLNIVIQDGANPAPMACGSVCSGTETNNWPEGNGSSVGNAGTTTVTVKPGSYFGYDPSNGDNPPLLGVHGDWPDTDGCNPDPIIGNSGTYNNATNCSSPTLTTNYGSTTANGTWTLTLQTVSGFPTAISITDWSVTITYATATPTTTVIGSNANPSNSSNTVTFTATVTSGSGTPTGAVTFTANGATIAGCGANVLSGGQTTCTTTLGQGNNGIEASYTPSGGFGASNATINQLVEATPTQSGNTWCNSGQITAPGNSAGIQYPSVIHISGYPAGATIGGNLTVELLNATGPAGVNAYHLLVAPAGQNLDFFDSTFAFQQPSSPVNLTIFDDAGQTPSGSSAPSTGNYDPYDGNQNGVADDTFPSSTSPSVDSNIPQVPGTINRAAPLGGTSFTNFQQAFSGAPANGDWALYTYAGGGESETIGSGWCVTLDVNTGVGTTTTVTASPNPQATGQTATITATVLTQGSNTPVTSGTVTFLDNNAVPAGVTNNTVNLDGNGHAQIATSSLAEGDHPITATYNGTSADNGSYGTVVQRINDGTTIYAANATISNGPSCGAAYCYCNGGPVSTTATYKGAFTPNPSILTVTDLPGTIGTVSLGLNQYSSSTDILYSLESMVVNPTGADLDFFSNAGYSSGGGTASLGNYIFSDAAGNPISSSVGTLTPGTYKPSSYPEGDPNWPEPAQPYFLSSSGFYTLPSGITYATSRGSGTFASQFGNTDPNGIWALYMTEDDPAGAASAAYGWCVNFTENPVTVSVDLNHQGTGTGTDFVQGENGAQITTLVQASNTTGPTGDPLGTNPLQVVDTLNAAFTYTGFTGTNWSCTTPPATTVTCTNDTAVAQGGSYPTLTLNVNVSSGASASISNGVTVTGAGITGNTGSDTITVDPGTTLAVSKSHTGNFTTGTTGQWTIVISNTAAGGATAGTVNVSDTLPTGYTLASYSSTSSLWTCSGASNVVTCSATPGIAGGSNSTINLTVNVPSNSPTSVSNTALAWGGGDAIHTSQGTAAASNTDSVTVDAAPAITSAGSTIFTAGTAGSFTVTTTGNPTASLSKTGSLPSGVTFIDNGNGTGTLSGTPAAGTGGTYPLTITAANGTTPNATQSFTLTVNQAPAITSAGSTTFTVSSAGSFTVTAAGNPAASLSETGSLPTGVTFVDNGNGTGTLSGTPAAASGGTYPLTIRASNGVGTNASQSFTLTVTQPPAITSAGSTTFTVGSAGSFTVTTTGNPTASLSKTGSLPSGVTFIDNGNGTGTLSGTPAAGTGGTYPLTITAANGTTPNATQSFTLTVVGPPAITSANSATFTAGAAGAFTVTTSGSPTPALSESGALPTGVTFIDNGNGTATFSGTATVAGSYPITITAQNGTLPNATQSFTLAVNPGAATYLAIPGGPEPFYTAFGFSIYAYDANNNLATSYNGTVAFSSSDPGFVNLGPVTLVNGVGSQTGVLKTAGTDSITATDVTNPSITGTGSFTIQPGVATHIGLVAPASTYAGSPISLTLTAYDLFGNVATSYGGTVTFTSTDPAAFLPGSSTITNGTGTFTAYMETAGPQTITATDAANSLAATSGDISVTIPALVVTTAADDAGIASNCTVQTTPGTGTDASCSLRDALLLAADQGSASITFDSTKFASATTITLANGTLNIPSNTTILGPTTGIGASFTNLVTIDGGGSSNNSPVFTTTSSAINDGIQNLVITDGGDSGIYNSYAAALTVQNSTVSGNNSTAGTSGIFNDYNASLTIIGSTISGNSGAYGAIVSEPGGTVSVSDSTISGNTASNNGGGGILSGGTSVTVLNSTITGNSAYSGGGILIDAGALTLTNSIVAGNIAQTTDPDINGAATDGGGNVIGDGTGLSGITNGTNGNQVGTSASPLNPLLAALDKYLGPTKTEIPLPGSPAICAINPSSATGTDQRGLPRTTTYNSTTCQDSGAVQTNYSLSFTAEPSNVLMSSVMSPSPVVTLDESGALFTASTVNIPLTLTGNGTLSGGDANTSGGLATYNLISIDTAGTGDTLTSTLTLNSASTTAISSAFDVISPANVLVFTPNPPAGATAGTAYSYQLNATGGTGPYTFSGTGLPAGLGVSNSQISGLCTGSSSNVILTANDSEVPPQTANAGPFSITCNPAPQITTTSLPPATLTVPYSTTITETGGSGPPVQWTLSPSTTGFSIDATTGVLSGTATTGTSIPFTITFTDMWGATDSKQLTLTVNNPPSFVVNTVTDDATGTASNCTTRPEGTCTLRDALAAAAAAGSGTITFGSTVFAPGNTMAQNTITLTNGTLIIPPYATLMGPTTASVAVSGNNAYTVFEVNPGAGLAGIDNLTVENGSGSTLPAGGVYVNGGSFGCVRCTIANNAASNANAPGGGIANNGGSVNVSNGTVANNTATGASSSSGGGAISTSAGGRTTIVNGTIGGNNSSNSGAAINSANGTTTTLVRTVLASNSNGGNCLGTISSNGNSVSDDASCNLSGTDDVNNANALLAPLGNYGGPAQTLIPLPGSPAICALSPSANSGKDERQHPRVTTYGTTTCQDAGAVQTNYSLTFTTQPQAISPATTIYQNTNFEAAVTLDESHIPFTAAGVNIPLTLSGTGSLSNNSAITASGIATYLTLQVSAPGTNDQLQTNLTLTAASTTQQESLSVSSSNFDVTATAAPAITSGNSTTFTVGSAQSFAVTASGSPAPTFSETGNLPSGVTLSSTGALSGTPAAGTGGVYAIVITATNSISPDATQNFTLTVNQSPAIISASNTTFIVGTAGSFTATATGYPASTFTETGSLPTGVTLSSTGVLSGTAAAGTGGVYPIVIRASNGVGSDSTQNFTLTVNQAPAITSANGTTFIVGTAGSFTVTGSGYPSSAFSETGNLPSGVTLSSSGVLSGTPAAGTGGVYGIVITSTNGISPNATQIFTLTVNQAPAITSASSTTFSVGTAGSFTATATGNPASTFSETGGLPTGVTLSSSGVLSGTPASGTGGVYAIVITASNGVGSAATQNFTLTVNETPAITSASSATFTVGTAGSFTVTANGYPAPTFSKTGALPTGVTLSSGGVLSGTPAAGTGGVYTFTITAINGNSPNASQVFTLTVDQAPAVTSAASVSFTAGTAGTFRVTTSGYPTAALAETGSLPSGVTFIDNGNGTAFLAGTPASGTGGSYSITIQAANGISPNAQQSFTLTVDQAPAITSASGATFNTGSPGNFTLTTTGYPAPTLTETGALPGGVSFIDNGNGTATLAGTPTDGGIFPITITAANGFGTNATQSFTLSVNYQIAVTANPISPLAEAPYTSIVGTFNVANNRASLVTFSTTIDWGDGTISAGIITQPGGPGTAYLVTGTHTYNASGIFGFTVAVTPTLGPVATGSSTATVAPAPATHLLVTAPASANVGGAFNFTVTALDALNNPTSGYSGLVHFTSTDQSAALPADAILTNGTGTFSATLMTVGSQTITATDATASSLTGTSGAISVTIPSFVVTNTDDSGPGSLRAVLANAASAGSGNITFDPTAFATAQTITLTSGTLNVPSIATITGPTMGSGASLTNLVTVNSGGVYTIFNVASGVTGSAIANLNISNGSGGITNAGTLKVTGSTFSNNLGNSGGIVNSGTLTVAASTFANNDGGSNGGGIGNTGTLTVTGSTFSGNNAPLGAGIYSTGTLTLSNSTIANNIAQWGGGIFINGGTATVTGTTDSMNSAFTSEGAGIEIWSGTLTLANTIVAGNGLNGQHDDLDSLGGSISGCISQSSQHTCSASGNVVGYYNDVLTADSAILDLAPLGNYGGTTQTMIPLPGSSAVCAGLASNIPTGVTTDQRGDSNINATYNGYSSTNPCVDSGAVQTNYSLMFSTEPPANVIAASNFSAGVTLMESNNPFIVTATPLPTITIPLTLNGNGALTNGSANVIDATGVASYSGMQVNLIGSDTLTANLTLNPNITPTALSISATSNSFTVGHASTTTTAASASATYNATAQNVTLSATVTSFAGTVNAGTVTFTVLQGSTPIGAAVTSGTVINGTASASYTLPAATTAGTYTIQAVYNGTAVFATSSDSTHTLTVNSAATTTDSSNATVTYSATAQSVTLAATVTSPSGSVNSGAVTFTVLQGGTPVGTAVTSATVSNGSASVSYNLPAGTAAGTYTIEAVYGGTASLQTSSDSTHTLTVNTAATTTAASNATATFSATAQSVTLAATITSPSGPVNSGTVTFTVLQGSSPVGTAVTTATVSNGAASVSYTLPAGTAAGTYTIQAVYSGTASLLTSSDSTHTLTIGKDTATVTLGNLAQTYTGSPISITATTTPPGLTVNITYSGSPNPPTTAGSYTVVGNISNANYMGSATGTLKIAQATPSITWATPAAITYGTALSSTQLDAAASFSGNSLAGTFAYSPAAGTVLAAGPHTLSATFTPADTTDYTTASQSTTIAVTGAVLTITANNATRVYGTANPAFTGSVTGQQNSDTFTESFTTAATISSPVSSYAIVPSVTGANLADYTQSIADGTLIITKAGSTITLGASSGSITPGQSVTLTAQVSSDTTGTPTGTVSFYDGTVLLNTAPLTAGVASYSTAALAPGITHALSATYNGDTTFNSSSSTASVTVVVAPLNFTMTLSGPSSATVVPGGSFTYQVTVTPDYGVYSGTVNFAVAGLPPGATETFSPTSIAANGGPQTITITIQTAPVTAMQQSSPPATGRHLAPFALAFLVLFGVGTMRKRGRVLRRMVAVALLLAGGAAATLLSGCGAKNGFFAQQPQNYTITITATSTTIQQSVTVNLNVE